MDNNSQQFQEKESLLIKYLAGSASAEERSEAISWIHENKAHQKFFDELRDYYQLTKVSQKPSGFSIEEGWNRVKQGYYNELQKVITAEGSKNSNRVVSWYILSASVAAAAVIAFVLGFYIHRQPSMEAGSPAIAYNEITVPKGARSQVALSDGSKVWLNAGSTLRYPASFSGKVREVFLEGEAFFDVAKMKHKQFVVKTSHVNIKVFGTQFDVSAYPEDPQIQTTLTRGSVSLEENSGKHRNEEVFMQPNQTAIFFKPEISGQAGAKEKIEHFYKRNARDYGNILVLQNIDPAIVTSWKDHRWVIVGEELGNLAVKLERRYNVKISFESGSLKKYKFSGTLSEETFEQVLKIIQLSAPILYKIENNQVVFKEDLLYKKKYDTLISNPQ